MRKSIFFSPLLFWNALTAYQITDTVIMISPDTFAFNEQTGITNSFQHTIEGKNIALEAQSDFDRMQTTLKQNGINVITLSSPLGVSTPDAVFPNWFSLHKEDDKNLLVLYPMLTENRQVERQVLALQNALSTHDIPIDEIIDLTYFELEGKALESTGSLVLDRTNKIAYASISQRTNPDVLFAFTEKMGYTPLMFSSKDEHGELIYHTDIMMSLGNEFAIICKDCITNPLEAENVIKSLKNTGKEIIYISFDQMHEMCANVLELKPEDGKVKIVMSDTAYAAFTEKQLHILQKSGTILPVNINTITTVGGGSARCMLAEVFYSDSKDPLNKPR